MSQNRYCPYCSGILGVDCFNVYDCGEVTRNMELEAAKTQAAPVCDGVGEQSPYKQFFLKLWDMYCSQEIDFDTADDILHLSLKLGLARAEQYDPSIHGEHLGYEWGIEEGEDCYVLAKNPEESAPSPIPRAELEKVREALSVSRLCASKLAETYNNPEYDECKLAMETQERTKQALAILDKYLLTPTPK